MPEPEKNEETPALGNLNKAAPFEVADEFHATMKHKLAFLFIPVGLGYFCGGWRGIDVGRYTVRAIVFGNLLPGMPQPAQDMATQIASDKMAQYHFHSDRWWAVENMFNPCLGLISGCFFCWSLIPKNSFSERSGFGVYCCAAYPRGRLLRMSTLTGQCNILDYFVCSSLMNPRLVPVGAVVPLIVFAWKRMKYLLQLLMCVEDSPYKDRALFSWTWTLFLFFNHSLSLGMAGAENWGTVIQFLLLDWIQFAIRVGLLMRIGMQTCPKMVCFFLQKQLENIPSPLPNHAAASGSKTAMRVNQSILCLLEGDSLSVNFVFILFWYVITYEIMGHNKASFIVPMRSTLIILLFAVLDFGQDVIASGSTAKFSNWSYLFAYEIHGSWHSKPMVFDWFVIYMQWICLASMWGGAMKCKIISTDAGHVPTPAVTNYAMPDFSEIHL